MIGHIFEEGILCKAEVADTGGLFVCAGLRAASDPNPITVLSSDSEALEAAFRSIGLWDMASVRMAWIINTAELTRLAISPALVAEAHAKGLSVSPGRFALPFDEKGELPGLRRVIAGPTGFSEP